METPSTRGDLGGIVGEWKLEVRRMMEDTLYEDFLDILGPDLAGSILEHLVMLTLRGDDRLAGGLAFCRVEGVWMIHDV